MISQSTTFFLETTAQLKGALVKKSQDIQQFINSLSDTEKQLALSVLTKPQTMAECCFSEAKTNNNRNYIDDSDNSRKHVRAFITAINFPSSLDEL